MNHKWIPVITGVVLAIVITTAMDASGYSIFSALPLLPLFLLFWWWQKFSRVEIGFKLGEGKYYVYAVAYPLVLMSILGLLAWLGGVVDTANTDWNKAMLNLFVGGLSTILVTIVTEEGFFRGWLWAGLKNAGLNNRRTMIVSSLAFMAWHISAVTLETGFDLPAKQVPIYLVNVIMMGLVWGMLRLLSGSIIVASVSHGVWNGIAYALFGFGETAGALGIQQSWIWGPEIGLLGLSLNVLIVASLWRHVSKHSIKHEKEV